MVFLAEIAARHDGGFWSDAAAVAVAHPIWSASLGLPMGTVLVVASFGLLRRLRDYADAGRKVKAGPFEVGERPEKSPKPAEPDIAKSIAELDSQALRASKNLPSNNEADRIRAENLLLALLVRCAKPGRTIGRRAAILIARLDANDGWVMEFNRGYPSNDFEPSHVFPMREWNPGRKGLCWEACARKIAAQQDPKRERKSFLMRVHDVAAPEWKKHFAPSNGPYEFRSILIAPIVRGEEMLGCVCLDSQEASFYTDGDEHMVEFVGELFETAWHARGIHGAATMLDLKKFRTHTTRRRAT